MKMKKNIIIIPSRLQATRFPNKPLVDINGLPMIVMVAKQAEKANIGEVVVACGDIEIFDVVKQHGINAIMTDNDLPSGSDRIYQALTKLEEKFDNIINVQGDVPTINPETIKIVANALNQDDKVAVSTACAKITINRVVDGTTLGVDQNIFAVTAKNYAIYGGTQEGAVLYIGSAGNIRVTTVAGDDVIFQGINTGTFFPVNVMKVWNTSTTASQIIALW